VIEQRDRTAGHPAEETVAAVQMCLNESPSLTDTHIRCEVAEDRIVLRGYVSTYSMKHAARVLAEGVSGDSRIEERLDVIPIPRE
jgi:osmotically-inducible protein OsmY